MVKVVLARGAKLARDPVCAIRTVYTVYNICVVDLHTRNTLAIE